MKYELQDPDVIIIKGDEFEGHCYTKNYDQQLPLFGTIKITATRDDNYVNFEELVVLYDGLEYNALERISPKEIDELLALIEDQWIDWEHEQLQNDIARGDAMYDSWKEGD